MIQLKEYIAGLRGAVPVQDFRKTMGHTFNENSTRRKAGQPAQVFGLKNQQPVDGN